MVGAAMQPKTWCDEDTHRKYEDYADFNEWFDGPYGQEIRSQARVEGLAVPSKAFFAGDREAYNATFAGYRLDQRDRWLSRPFLKELCGDSHWFDRNTTRFDQLCNRLENGDLVPFIGAGLSNPGGFPTWKDHLRQQWRTAHLPQADVEAMLVVGAYETIIEQIERTRGRDVFVQELRDAFDRNGILPDSLYLISELFRDTLITTNYDRLIEQSFDVGDGKQVQTLTPSNVLSPPDAESVTVVKLHGDIRTPAGCILSKSQYDVAYGAGAVDLGKSIPQALDYYFRNSSLLFLGCSLNQDRTIQVFEAVKASINPDEVQIPQHFSIEQCPADQGELATRNENLLRLGITPIWFPPGEFDCVEGILRLARNELRHRRA
jgi:hypothetical protein